MAIAQVFRLEKAMSAQHTQGRLTVHGEGFMRGLHLIPWNALKGDTQVIARCDTALNARRLAACWNACEGIGTEVVEDAARNGALGALVIVNARAMKAELQLAAARALLEEVVADVPADYSDQLTESIRAFLKGQP